MFGRLQGAILVGAAALSLAAANSALAQRPGGSPAGAPAGRPPGAGGGDAGISSDGGFSQLMPPDAPLTPAQELVKNLPSPEPGVGGGGLPLAPDAPMPASDPRDLQGTWFHNQPLEFRMQKDMFGKWLPYNDAGAKVLQRRVMALHNGTPISNASAICRPPGILWQHDLASQWQVFQSKDWIEFVFLEYHGRWHVVLNPAAAPKPAEKQYMGYSVGHWEGSTLVVETTDLKQGVYLDVDGTPLSRDGKTIQRIRKVDNGDREPYLEIITTVIDPAYYTKPWSVVRSFGWDPDGAAFREYNCEEQIGDPAGSPDAGLALEPAD